MLRILTLFALLTLLPALQAAAVPTLDGRSFVVELAEEDGGKPQGKDTIAFAGGSGDCEQAGKKYGYAKGLYKAMKGKNKDEVLFRFTMTSAEHGELLFEGAVQGGAITGKRTWTKPNKPPIVHRFTGRQQ